MELPDPDVGVEDRPRARSGLHDRHEAERTDSADGVGESHSLCSYVPSSHDHTNHSSPRSADPAPSRCGVLCVAHPPVRSVPQRSRGDHRALAQHSPCPKFVRVSRAHPGSPIAIERAPPRFQTTHTRPRDKPLQASPLGASGSSASIRCEGIVIPL